MATRIHPTADVSAACAIGDGTVIWHYSQVREGARIGEGCVIGRGVYIDRDVCIGNHVKIQNYVSVYQGVTLEDGVFCGPYSVFTNDKYPRAVNPDGSLKAASDWATTPTWVRQGASIGANATVVCGSTIGCWAMVGAGAVVTRDVPDYALVCGVPARVCGFVCPCGRRLAGAQVSADAVILRCPQCGREVTLSRRVWEEQAAALTEVSLSAGPAGGAR